jgi:hypothetical protein
LATASNFGALRRWVAGSLSRYVAHAWTSGLDALDVQALRAKILVSLPIERVWAALGGGRYNRLRWGVIAVLVRYFDTGDAGVASRGHGFRSESNRRVLCMIEHRQTVLTTKPLQISPCQSAPAEQPELGCNET